MKAYLAVKYHGDKENKVLESGVR